MPFILSIPEAVMTFELSSLYPCASGGVRFVRLISAIFVFVVPYVLVNFEEMFHIFTTDPRSFWGSMGSPGGISWWASSGLTESSYFLPSTDILFFPLKGWIAGIAHISSLPILFLSFVQHQFFPQVSSPDNLLLFYGILAGTSAFLTFINYRGLDVVANATVLIFFFTLAPFVLLVIIGIPKGKVALSDWLLNDARNCGYSPHSNPLSSYYVTVDPMKWLQTPSGEVDPADDDSLGTNGWFPLTTIAGVACECSGP